MSIRVDSPGIFTTVQDLGRPGHGTLGISAAGAADPVALRAGNALVGNPPGAGALEMTMLGGTFTFTESAAIALTGAEFESVLEGRPVAWWSALQIHGGQTLHVRRAKSGARCYLSVGGGIEVPEVFGSRSTHVFSGLGGLEGRSLRKGDVLAVGRPACREASAKTDAASLYGKHPIRITRTTQTSRFTEKQCRLLAESEYRVSTSADRMGLRLEGPKILHAEGSMVTEGVPLGAIQVPAGGQPIILFVDHQTTGGYPKIAAVVSADMHRVGQLRPGDAVRFEWVSPERARGLLLELERLLA